MFTLDLRTLEDTETGLVGYYINDRLEMITTEEEFTAIEKFLNMVEEEWAEEIIVLYDKSRVSDGLLPPIEFPYGRTASDGLQIFVNGEWV